MTTRTTTRTNLFLALAILSASSASCSKDSLTAPRAHDAAADTSSVGFCFAGGTSYAVGQSFVLDCSGCTCTPSGIECTVLLCPSPSGTGGAGGTAGTTEGVGGSLGAGGSLAAGGTPSGGSSGTADVAPFVCIENDHTYAIGQSFSLDCNTCTCSSSGTVCTKMACLRDAGPDFAACTLSSNLTFGHVGGEVLFSDVNRLTASSFTITRTYVRSMGSDGAATSTCAPTLPDCGAPDAVTIATINADLAAPDVQSLWSLPQSPVPLFGSDPRPVDGTVYSIALDDGREVLVGEPCASPAMSSCRSIPAGLVRLTQDLQKMAKAMLGDPSCSRL